MYYGHCLNNMTCTGLLHMETKFEILTQFAIFCNQKAISRRSFKPFLIDQELQFLLNGELWKILWRIC